MILLGFICCDPPRTPPSDIHANGAIRNEQLSLKLNIDLPENFLISLHLHF